jgi:putative spermidine/putrescine transport system substrate-binding protein
MTQHHVVPTHSRREFLRAAAGFSTVAFVGVGPVLAACGGEEESEPSATTGGTETMGPVGPATLNFVGWEGYDGSPKDTFAEHTAWMGENELDLNATYVQDNEEMLTKIQASPQGTYDLTSPYHGTVPTMILADVLEPIDTTRMENFEAIFSAVREEDYIRGEDGTVYAVPFTFSYQVALYNADRGEPLQSYAEVVENAALKDRYTLIDAPEHFTWIAKILGFGNPDPHHLTEDELQQCQDYARRVIQNAQTVASSYGDILQLMTSQEVDYSLSGTADQADAAQAEGVNVAAFFPVEGTQSFVDNYCIPKESENYDAALAWIDHMLTPEVQAEVAQVFSGAVVNLDAVPLLSQKLRDLYAYDDLDSVFEKTPVYPPIPPEGDEYATYADWTKAWNEVK